MSRKDQRVLLGRIVRPHGVRGEVVIESYTAAPEDIAAYGPLETEDAERRLEIAVVRAQPRGIVARIAGIADRSSAEALAGCALYVARARLPATSEDEFYRADLVGLRAEDREGRTVGSVVAVANYGAGDLLELRLSDQGKTELIPFSAAFVPVVDIAGGRVVVELPAEESED